MPGRNHFFSKVTLTEKLIEIVPDIDIHIIPDAVKTRKLSETVIYMVCGKTVCKGLFSDGFYICSMYFDWSAVSEAEFHGYEYCNHIHSGSFAYFHCDRWLSLQCGRIFLKCLFILLFSDRTKDVFSDLCGGLSGDLSHNAYFICTYGSTCGKAENTCKACLLSLLFVHRVLFDTDRLLQKAKGETEILDVTCTQLLRLLNRNITAYVVENGALSDGKLFSVEKERRRRFFNT